mgnify:CR=1 FL=1
MELQLRISGHHYEELKKHLFPGDGKEAIAIALCGRYSDETSEILLVHELTLIPYDECSVREPDLLQWSTRSIQHYFEKIGSTTFALLKIHSHPNDYNNFSKTDDMSDYDFFDSAFGWASNNKPHASAIMLPSGEIFGRFFFEDLHHEPINKVMIVSDIIYQFTTSKKRCIDGFALRTIQAFGEQTYEYLRKMRIGVVGCSGTGSLVVEQLARLGVGQLLLIDPDTIENKNLNRILNAFSTDVNDNVPKVVVLAKAIEKMGLETVVETHQVNLYDSIKALKALAKCDFIFGCVDSIDGRHLLNQLASFYILPYFDLGVKLEANGQGGINKICGTVNYIQPSKSSLITRSLYDMEDLRASSQYRKNPEEFELLRKNAYIKNINVERPAVISVNMQIASHAINEFLNRIHPFKGENPSYYAASTIDITEGCIINAEESSFMEDVYLKNKVGRGDMTPFIEMSELIL